MRNFVFNVRQGWLMIMLLSCLFVSAYDFEVDGIYYNVTDMANLECEVTKGDNPYVRLEIPSTVTLNNRTFTVKRIGDEACEYCYDMMRVELPNTITSIGDKAFSGCISLTKVTIPGSVLCIGEKAFGRCSSLESVSIGNSVTEIGNYAFEYCEKLKDLKIGDSVKKIGRMAFENCESLERVELPNTVEFLGEMAFYECYSLSKVRLSNNLKIIEPGTFNRCRQLEEIRIPGSVERIVGSRLYDNDSEVFSDLRIIFLDYSDNELVCGEYSRKYDREDNWGYDVFNEGSNNLNEPNFIKGETWCRNLKVVFFNRQIKPAMRLPEVVKLYFGEELKTVPIRDFQESDRLKTIVCLSSEPPVLPEGSNKQYLNVVVKVPQEALQKYQEAPVWKNFMLIEGYEPSEREHF